MDVIVENVGLDLQVEKLGICREPKGMDVPLERAPGAPFLR